MPGAFRRMLPIVCAIALAAAPALPLVCDAWCEGETMVNASVATTEQHHAGMHHLHEDPAPSASAPDARLAGLPSSDCPRIDAHPADAVGVGRASADLAPALEPLAEPASGLAAAVIARAVRSDGPAGPCPPPSRSPLVLRV